MKDASSKFSVSKARDRVLVSTDIETGGDDDKSTVETELFCNFLPCMYEKTPPQFTESIETSGSIIDIDKSDLILVVSKSESCQEDSRPPPLTKAVSTSETDEDEEIDESKFSRNESHTDPFAPREGKTLCWRNVNMTLVRLSISKR
jgi:hypothetical protein